MVEFELGIVQLAAAESVAAIIDHRAFPRPVPAWITRPAALEMFFFALVAHGAQIVFSSGCHSFLAQRAPLLRIVCLPRALAPVKSRPRAGMAELVDAPDLGSGIERCAGSSPVPGTFGDNCLNQINSRIRID